MKFSIITIIVFVLHATVTADNFPTCPDEDTINPCKCRSNEYQNHLELTCTDKNMTLESLRIALNAFKGQSIETVQLTGLKLDVVPSDFFRDVHITDLAISNCKLDSLSDNGGKPLQGLEDTLEVIEIKSSFEESGNPAMLSVNHLHSLISVYLTDNSINVLSNDWFKNAFPSLTSVILEKNKIMTIGKRAFADIKNLEDLTVSGNRFGPISRSMMPNPAIKLERLSFEDNGLRNLPNDIFTNMPALKSVALSDNGLTVIPENIWESIWKQLKSVKFFYNPLICDDDLNWMLSTPTCAAIKGTCRYPRRLKGQKIPCK